MASPELATIVLPIAGFLLPLLAVLTFSARAAPPRERFSFSQTLTLLGTPAAAAVAAVSVLAADAHSAIRPLWLQYVTLAGIPAAFGLLLGLGLAVRRARRP